MDILEKNVPEQYRGKRWDPHCNRSTHHVVQHADYFNYDGSGAKALCLLSLSFAGPVDVLLLSASAEEGSYTSPPG